MINTPAPPNLSIERISELHRTAERYMAANRVSIVIGLVLVPVIFAGASVGLWLGLPAPFGKIVGGSIAAVGVVMMLCLLYYRNRALGQPPFIALATVEGWHEIRHRQGGSAYSLQVQIHQAWPLAATDVGGELTRYRGQSRKLTLTGPALFQVAAPDTQVLLVCMPTEEVVAIDVDGQLTTA